MSSRSFNASSSRYGFNGKENDREVVATGEGTQDYGMRIYNPSLSKFFSLDPLTPKYPFLSPYQFASNSPIVGVDEDGGELKYYNLDRVSDNGKSYLRIKDNIFTENAAFEVSIKVGITSEKSEVAKFTVDFSELSLSAVVVPHNGEWRVLPEEFNPNHLPDENDEVWDSFETPEEYKARVLESAQKVALGISVGTGSGAKGSFLKDIKNSVNKLKISSNTLKEVAKSAKSLIKNEKLPTSGKIRFIPRPEDVKSGKLLKKDGGFVDKFGNVWKKPKGNIQGEFHWDVQLSETGKKKIGWLSNSGKHVNVTQKGKVAH